MHPSLDMASCGSFFRIHGRFWQDTQQALVEPSIPLKPPLGESRTLCGAGWSAPGDMEKQIPSCMYSRDHPLTKGHIILPAPKTKVCPFRLFANNCPLSS